MTKDKEKALNLLRQKKTNLKLTYETISAMCGYTKRQLIRLNATLEEKEDMTVHSKHGNVGRTPINKASETEIEYIRRLKLSYPNITITQFRDIYLEDVIFNPAKKDDVEEYNLRVRSNTWFRNLFEVEGWKSPESKRPKKRDGRSLHPLRQPSPRRGMLIQIDGTPFDWLNNGEMWTLHLAVDDATTEVLSGYFMKTERQLGYCFVMRDIFENYGIPMAIYSDKHTIFKSHKDENLTQFGMMMERMGVELIFANSAQAKGRVERYNGTVQRRLPNDIIRFKIDNYDELNVWFNTYYKQYLNNKFAFSPKDYHDEFVPLYGFDTNLIFEQTFIRTIKEDTFSIDSEFYRVVDENDNPVHIINGTQIEVRISVFTKSITVINKGLRYNAKFIMRKRNSNDFIINNQKDLIDCLSKMRSNKDDNN